MIHIQDYISGLPSWLLVENKNPWDLINDFDALITNQLKQLSQDYKIENGIAIHKNAVIEPGAVLKGAIVISDKCFIGAGAYLRGPIYLGSSVKIGPGTEIKQTIVAGNSSFAHFNYVGNSVIGENVNFEAGSVCANHFNEKQNKNIFVIDDGEIINTKTDKFGALVGDDCRIGANAVLTPGTILKKGFIVKRLELVEQIKPND